MMKAVTHRFRLDRIEEMFEALANQRDAVRKVAINAVIARGA